MDAQAEVRFAAELRMFLAPRHRAERHRAGQARVCVDGVSSLGHVIESCGVPLTETGRLTVNGRQAASHDRLASGDVAEVSAVRRPQPVPSPRFILDVHLGTLARRLRLVGVDAAYTNDADDDTLIERANASRRVLLTKDRGLLRRHSLWLGGYVRGSGAEDQLRDVLERFAPPLAPWTRCTSCNCPLAPVRKADVEPVLPPGTQRTYQAFSRCLGCGRVYWRGAHSWQLQQIVDSALGTAVATRRRDALPLWARAQSDGVTGDHMPNHCSAPQASNRPASVNPSFAARRIERALAVWVKSTTGSPGSSPTSQPSAAAHASAAYPNPHASGRNR
jgi:hypothetical protein